MSYTGHYGMGQPTTAVPTYATIDPAGVVAAAQAQVFTVAGDPAANGRGDVVNGNGNGKANGGGPVDKAKSWWGDRSNVEKGAVVVGGIALVGLLVYALARPRRARPNRYKPNLSSAESKRVRDAKRGSYVKVGDKRYKVGKITAVKGGRSFGHKIPPKKYRQKGARRQDDYAWPDGYMYPLVFRTKTGRIKPQLTRKHIRAAARYYGKNRDLYPPPVRRKIARNINRAKKRFGIGGEPARA